MLYKPMFYVWNTDYSCILTHPILEMRWYDHVILSRQGDFQFYAFFKENKHFVKDYLVIKKAKPH